MVDAHLGVVQHPLKQLQEQTRLLPGSHGQQATHEEAPPPSPGGAGGVVTQPPRCSDGAVAAVGELGFAAAQRACLLPDRARGRAPQRAAKTPAALSQRTGGKDSRAIHAAVVLHRVGAGPEGPA